MPLSFLSARGNELLERAKRGRTQGLVSHSLMRDIDSVLLDGDETRNDAIDRALRDLGLLPPGSAAFRRCVECGRGFDLQDPADADEWAYGHDCE